MTVHQMPQRAHQVDAVIPLTGISDNDRAELRLFGGPGPLTIAVARPGGSLQGYASPAEAIQILEAITTYVEAVIPKDGGA